jgi:hypothetical protein
LHRQNQAQFAIHPTNQAVVASGGLRLHKHSPFDVLRFSLLMKVFKK